MVHFKNLKVFHTLNPLFIDAVLGVKAYFQLGYHNNNMELLGFSLKPHKIRMIIFLIHNLLVYILDPPKMSLTTNKVDCLSFPYANIKFWYCVCACFGFCVLMYGRVFLLCLFTVLKFACACYYVFVFVS